LTRSIDNGSMTTSKQAQGNTNMKTPEQRATKIVENFNLHTEGNVKVDAYGFLSMVKDILKDKGCPTKERMEIVEIVNKQMKEQDNFL